LHIQELANGQVQALTDTIADENPSFAPNSRMIIYATQQQGREALMTTTIDGKVKARLAGQSGDMQLHLKAGNRAVSESWNYPVSAD
jgi:TolB protein